ncbi:SPOR domain-containing protein [Myxosarcina sp. GI1]|uniref:SPOR domain-containing protein n=1 Tax=Myxosarcina sp. GI1 TaxID=1541065 RepID=UPI00068B780A|nr:SPOR domain-containing protein [Myxosarcina sp. GI1]
MTNKLNSQAANYLSLVISSTMMRTLLGMGLLIIATAVPTKAQSDKFITELLPPPPPVASPNRVAEPQYKPIVPVDLDPPTYTSKEPPREYTFSAPPPEDDRDYRVEVFGNERELLDRVRAIEPKAFQKGNVIQVGIFSRQDNAEDLVRKLAVEGFWARIIISESY